MGKASLRIFIFSFCPSWAAYVHSPPRMLKSATFLGGPVALRAGLRRSWDMDKHKDYITQ